MEVTVPCSLLASPSGRCITGSCIHDTEGQPWGSSTEGVRERSQHLELAPARFLMGEGFGSWWMRIPRCTPSQISVCLDVLAIATKRETVISLLIIDELVWLSHALGNRESPCQCCTLACILQPQRAQGLHVARVRDRYVHSLCLTHHRSLVHLIFRGGDDAIAAHLGSGGWGREGHLIPTIATFCGFRWSVA